MINRTLVVLSTLVLVYGAGDGALRAAAASLENQIPASFRDFSGFGTLQFRATINIEDSRNPSGAPQDFSVELVDGSGGSESVRVSDFSDALFFPPGTDSQKIILNGSRIPLSAYGSVDLSNITAVRFLFDQPARGALLLSDVLLDAQADGATAPDPALTGPFAVDVDEYDFGDQAFTPPDPTWIWPVEVIASVHYPQNLAAGPFPLVLFMHGRHATCYDPVTSGAFLQWPCTGSRLPIPSYQGYDYVASILASHGYIVVSVGANGINARDNSVPDLGMLARAQLLQHHLGIWETFNTTGGVPFGNTFVGRVDLNNIGTMGHSRGGEGVVRHYVLNEAQGQPFGIEAVFPLAPVDFNRPVINNVDLAVMLPYCDGDVSDLQGMHFFDDALYNVSGDTGAKHTILVMGANHNFFNTVWTPSEFGPGRGTSDDWRASSDPQCGVSQPTRLSEAEQRGTLLAYLTAFFRTYLGGESQFLPLLRGDQAPPPSAMTDDIFLTFHPVDDDSRLEINHFAADPDRTMNELGGTVVEQDLTPYELCGGESPQDLHCLATLSGSRQPHTTTSARSSRRGLGQLRFGWSDGAVCDADGNGDYDFGDVLTVFLRCLRGGGGACFREVLATIRDCGRP